MVTMHLCHAPPMQIFCRSDLLAISLRPGGAVTEDRGFPVDAGPQDSTRLNPAKLTRDRGGVDEAGWRRRRPPRNKSSRAIVDDFSSAPMAVPHIARGRVGQRGVQRGLLDKLHQSGFSLTGPAGHPTGRGVALFRLQTVMMRSACCCLCRVSVIKCGQHLSADASAVRNAVAVVPGPFAYLVESLAPLPQVSG